jgi:hypothetical protein
MDIFVFSDIADDDSGLLIPENGTNHYVIVQNCLNIVTKLRNDMNIINY